MERVKDEDAPLIYLDNDGVLNNTGSLAEHVHIMSEKVKLLRRIIMATNARIVVSSSWRKSTSLETLREIYWVTGGVASSWVIGVTPSSRTGFRGDEIRMWEEANWKPRNYLIIDDDSDFHPDQKPHHLHTSHQVGLVEMDLNDAVRVLRGEYLFPVDRKPGQVLM